MVVETSQAGRQLGPEVATFLFTDIEGSTRLLQELGSEFTEVLQRHHALLHETVAAHDGIVRRTEGDSFFATFSSASRAVAAAVQAQRDFAAEPWPTGHDVRIRIGIHTGEAIMAEFEVVGLDVHRAARIMAAGWGDQVLVSRATRELLGDGGEVALRDLGEHRLKDLAAPEHLFQVLADGLRTDFPALRSLDRITNNLPTQLTPFIGRSAEIAAAAALLQDTRLLTLTGPGGTGKTRLSMQVAAEVIDGFPDGVFFVPLAPLADPDLLHSALAGSIGLTDASTRAPAELVTEHLRDRVALLVLDNFEQVLGAGPLVAKLLADAPGLRAIVSSRSPLRVYGEQEYPVPPLDTPAARSHGSLDDLGRSEAVALFVSRARAVDPSFVLTDSNAAAVAEITRRLDGLPLAIELAAARTRLLAPEALVERLGSRLDLLKSGSTDLPDRQRTLRGAIDWSHDLLAPAAQSLLAQFAVFSGGAELAQIEAVCQLGPGGDVLDQLGELIDQSLVVRSTASRGTRFAMLETIREYASEKLSTCGLEAGTRDRHLEAYLSLAQQAAPHLTTKDGGSWLDRLEADHDNLRAATTWALDAGALREGLSLIASIWRMWQIRGHLHEARRICDEVLGLAGVEDHPAELLATREAAGGVCYWMADLEAARQHYSVALELSRASGDEATIARQLYNLAFSFPRGADHTEAVALFTEAAELFTDIGDHLGAARAEWGLATIAMDALDFAETVQRGSAALAVFRASNEAYDLSWALHVVGLGHHGLGELGRAHDLYVEALERFRLADDRTGLYLVFADFALLAEATGDLTTALRLFGKVEHLSDETGSTLLDSYLELLPRKIKARDAVEPDERDRLLTEGRHLTTDEAIALANSIERPGS